MVIRLDENYNAMTSTALLGYVGETNARPVSVEGLTDRRCRRWQRR